ncbi:MAG: ligand-binding protein SH3 [Magnetovibrio sp.]|nr:ligand-binding protein SH3 [Magnetovibrio sp.]|tara:strand:+ start:552 stop:875 length:324 start_codon:yes stop_codon:yes gene_type:complete
MSWLLLSISIITEVLGTVALKFSNGFSDWKPSVIVFTAYILSFVLLGLALKGIELSIAYAIWAGVGTALIALVGIFYFNEPITIQKSASIVLIVLGVVGLNLSNQIT